MCCYFGGGTPSLMSPNNLKEILSTIDEYYKRDSNTELSLECNPDNITLELLDNLA